MSMFWNSQFETPERPHFAGQALKFLKSGFSSSVSGWITKHGSDQWRLRLVSRTRRACTEWQILKNPIFSLGRDVWTPATGGEGALPAFGSGRWRADGKYVSISRGTSVLLQLWALVTQICRDTKQGKAKNTTLDNGSEIYMWSFTNPSVTDYFLKK